MDASTRNKKRRLLLPRCYFPRRRKESEGINSVDLLSRRGCASGSHSKFSTSEPEYSPPYKHSRQYWNFKKSRNNVLASGLVQEKPKDTKTWSRTKTMEIFNATVF
mmetsp:Transcript_5641/g.16203  ORF Transcript_5641/g.16203 Transcript_5641/m.16203 type:complete len:106 (-) Transcript_5641:901-1218(-)